MTAKSVEEKINLILSDFGVPAGLIPKVNYSNDFTYPFVEIGDDDTLYLVVREAGFELDRLVCHDIKLLLKAVYAQIASYLAPRLELQQRKDESDYSVQKIKKIEKELFDKFTLYLDTVNLS